MTKIRLGWLLWLLPSMLSANQVVEDITIGYQHKLLTLTAHKSRLPQVLAKLSDATGINIHAGSLPSYEINAQCAGASIKPVLECLLQGKADMVISYSETKSNTQTQVQEKEIWLVNIAPQVETGAAPKQSNVVTNDMPDKTGLLLNQAKSENPDRRAEAISALALVEPKHNAVVHAILEDALSDQAPKVRAQAIASLARRQCPSATAILQQALQDTDASVRLMVIDHAGDNIELLQQALTDTDRTVRSLAVLKLAEVPTSHPIGLH